MNYGKRMLMGIYFCSVFVARYRTFFASAFLDIVYVNRSVTEGKREDYGSLVIALRQFRNHITSVA